jgi:hypothetical protein
MGGGDHRGRARVLRSWRPWLVVVVGSEEKKEEVVLWAVGQRYLKVTVFFSEKLKVDPRSVIWCCTPLKKYHSEHMKAGYAFCLTGKSGF